MLNFVGGAAQFTLCHGQQITVKNLPADCSITVNEQTPEGYSVSYSVNGAPETSAALTLKNSSTIDVVNRMAEVPDTGISSAKAGIAAALLSGAVGILSLELLRISKRRRNGK